MDVDAVTVPAGKLLQVEIDLGLEGAEPGRAGLDPAGDIGEEIGGVVKGKSDALPLESGPQAIPIAGQILLASRGRIVRALRLTEGLRLEPAARASEGQRGQCQSPAPPAAP